VHLNRKYQLDFLHKLAGCYPDYMPGEMVQNDALEWCEKENCSPCHVGIYTGRHSRFATGNIHYLAEHELIEFGSETSINKSYWGDTHKRLIILDTKITATGLDFIENDGGLSAILNTVTVKFDVDNVRELVAAGLLTAHVPEDKQGVLNKAIREAPGTMLQTAVSKMVEKGMSDPMGTAKAVAGLFGIAW